MADQFTCKNCGVGLQGEATHICGVRVTTSASIVTSEKAGEA